MANTKDVRLSNEVVNAQADAQAVKANNGYLRIYDGVRPATGDTAVGAQVLLAELRMNATAFGAAVNGVITANALTPDASANAGGTASWFRILKSDGTSPIWDGEVGTATSDLILNSVTIGAGAQVSVTAFTHTVTK